MSTTISPHEHFHDFENERALAYLAIADFPAYRVLEASPADFASPLYRAIVSLAEATYEDHGQAGPNEQLARALTRGADQDMLSAVMRQEALDTLLDPPLGSVPDADRLFRHRDARALKEGLQGALTALQEGRTGEALALVDEAREEAAGRLRGAGQVRTARELVEMWVEHTMKRGDQPGISPGLPKLKAAIGDLSPASVLVVGGATNVGKSSFILEMIIAAANDGTIAGLISVEDTLTLTTERLISALSGLSARSLHMGHNFKRATEACMQIAAFGGRVLASECIGGDEQDVCARMTVMANRGAKLIVVDYIGEVQASIRQQDRRNEIRWLMKRLKAHAVRLGVALVVVSQLARPKDGETKRKPNKHSLKEAGDLENSAEFIVLLWREDEHDFAPINVELAKSKIGGVGKHWLMQREIREASGQPGSARLREVVQSHHKPEDADFPLVVTNFDGKRPDPYDHRNDPNF